MQHMKKVHSLDYSAPNSSGARSGPTLMHSVSIVVELANEVYLSSENNELQLQPMADSDHESDEILHQVAPRSIPTTGDERQQQQQFGSSQDDNQTRQLSSEKHRDENDKKTPGNKNELETEDRPRADESDDDDDEEDDDEEEEECCLGSGLARRVVIVDEADKIFLGRAHSASPRFSCIDQAQLQQQQLPLDSNDTEPSNQVAAVSSEPLWSTWNDSTESHKSPDSTGCTSTSTAPPPPTSTTTTTTKPTCSQGQLQDQLASMGSPCSPSATNLPICFQQRASSACGSRQQPSPLHFKSPETIDQRRRSRRSFAFPSPTLSSAECDGGASGGELHQLHQQQQQQQQQQQRQLYSLCGSSELAERGLLSKLSMRRNTHHHVNFNPSPSPTNMLAPPGSSEQRQQQPPPGCFPMGDNGDENNGRAGDETSDCSSDGAIANLFARRQQQQQQAQPALKPVLAGQLSVDHKSSRPLNSAQLSSSSLAALARGQQQHQNPLRQQKLITNSGTSATTTTAIKHHHHHNHHQQYQSLNSVVSNQHRRQSLQINLLAGGSINQSSKSLTEEELRGEREFNEQVRQIAKSPDLLSNPFHLKSTASPTAPNCGFAHHQSGGAFKQQETEPQLLAAKRRQSTTATAEHPKSSTTNKSSIAPPQHQRRRVSFSSIDPIIVSAKPQVPFAQSPAKTKTFQLSNNSDHQHRSRHHQQRASISGSLLFDSSNSYGGRRERDTTDCSQDSAAAANFSSCSKPPADRTGRTILKHQGYSLASDSPPATLSFNKQQSKGEREEADVATDENDNNLLETIMTSLELSEKSRKDLTGDNSTSAAAAHSEPQDQNEAGRMNDTANKPAANRRLASLDSNSEDKSPADSNQTQPHRPPQQQHRRREIVSSVSTTTPPPTAPAAAATTMTTNPSCPLITRRHQSIGGDKDESKVQSIMANARLRQEEFARLLEEHEQIVNEINRFENKISNTTANQINLKQQQQPAAAVDNIGKQLNEDEII